MATLYVFGNGLSILFRHEQFSLEALTERVRAILSGVAGPGGVSAWSQLQGLAQVLTADHQTEALAAGGFEAFAGPLERLAAGVRHIVGLVSIGSEAEVTALKQVEARATRLYRQAVGAVLEAVTATPGGGDWGALSRVAAAVVDANPHDLVTDVFVLNYDALLDSALLSLRDERRHSANPFDLADEFDGRNPTRRPINGHELESWSWRTASVTPLRRSIRLHHLHGAANWMRSADGIFKGRLDEVRNCGLYGKWTRGEAVHHSPVLVLGDSKERLVAREPFDEAYQSLRGAIAESSLLVVAGYGFGDVPLNRAIHDCLPAGTQLVVVNSAPMIGEFAAAQTGIASGRIRVVPTGLPEGLETL